MAYLKVIEGGESDAVFVVTRDCTLGRSNASTFQLEDELVSRIHARILRNGNSFSVMDLGSANGTFVNKSPLIEGRELSLGEGDVISMGSSVVIFHHGEAPDGARIIPPSPGTGSLEGGETESMQKLPGISRQKEAPAEFSPSPDAMFDASLSMVDASLSMVQGCTERKGTENGLREAVRRLQAMVQVSSDLGEVTDIDSLLSRIMKSIFSIFPQADRAFIMLRDPDSGEMLPRIARERRGADEIEAVEADFSISRTITDMVVGQKQAILSSDAQDDDRFDCLRSIISESIRAVACVPFIWEEEVLGLISVDTSSKTDSFDSEDLMMLTGIAGHAAIAIKSAELYDAVQVETRKRTMLSRYVSPDVVEGVLAGSIPIQLSGEKKYGTVFFCDVVGFTAMSEKLDAVEIIDRLNAHFRIATEIVARNDGTLHKFGGDMIMAFWNVLLPDSMAELHAVRAGLEMQAAIWEVDAELAVAQQHPIYLGVGINSGEFAGGNVGGEMIEYTIIGDNVNLAQRIESAAGRWQVFVSESTYSKVEDQCVAVELPPLFAKGKSVPIRVFSIRGLQVEPGEMLLSLAVRILARGGRELGTGFLTGVREDERGCLLDLSTQVDLRTEKTISLEVDLPEFSLETCFEGCPVQVDTVLRDDRDLYFRVAIGDIVPEEEFRSLIVPGSLVKSGKGWAEMKRR